MKQVAIALVFTVVCGSAYAQDLKDLEPLIGTYRSEWTSANTGGERERLVTYSWSYSKKMLVAEGKIRRAAPGREISNEPWTTETRLYFVWNHVAKRIEMIDVNALAGAVRVYAVKSKEAGVFSFLPVSSTLNDKAKADMLVIVTEEGMTLKLTNRLDADGEPMDDAEYTSKRVDK